MASSSSTSNFPMENDWEYLHGRIDPGQEENFDLVDSVPVEQTESSKLQERNELGEAVEPLVTVSMPPSAADVGEGMSWRTFSRDLFSSTSEVSLCPSNADEANL